MTPNMLELDVSSCHVISHVILVSHGQFISHTTSLTLKYMILCIVHYEETN